MSKKIRVYDPKGDFQIEIPDDTEVTFGYFNPAASGEGRDKWGNPHSGQGSQTMKTTALRIYEVHGRKKQQISCFLGVTGFRDETAVKLTKLNQKVIIETNYEDDGDGGINFGQKQQRQITAMPEPGSYQ